ncbi:MAG: acetoin utilization protein AcuC, partial [Pseudomonadota bacterium]
PEMFSRPATAAGGSMLGAELVASGGVVYNPGGGTHHGMADRANGFCFLNDPVLAIRNLQRLGQDRVAYVDIDAHHCDGVEAALTGEPGICLISIHEGRRWPFTGALSEDARGIAWNLPVGRGLNDTEFALILDDLILPVLSSFKPDAIILQCGADALFDDPLSRMELSNNALWSAVASIRRLTQKLLVLGGGGYNPWSVARAWTGVWANLSGQTVPDHLPSAARTVLDRLSWSRRAGRTPPEHWVNTLRDPVRHGRIRDEIKADIATLKRRLTG